MQPAARSRLPLLDAVKAAASQLIVWHHLALYGPMPEAAYPLAPGLMDWLYTYARLAVQVFLVIGGFLAARSLWPKFETGTARLPQTIWHRYRRLVRPYFVALALALVAEAAAREWMARYAESSPPTLAQIAAHVLLIQDVAGFEALSAGVWYVAIDFHLYALLACVLAMGKWPAAVCGAATALSLFWWNRNPELDVWAPYFFASYGLGVLAERITTRGRNQRLLWIGALALLVSAALVVEWRSRIALAGATALLLAVAGTAKPRWAANRAVAWLARISYPLFLIHYPVSLLVSIALFRMFPGSPVANGLGMMAAWAAGIASAAVLARWTEPAGINGNRATARIPSESGAAPPVPNELTPPHLDSAEHPR